MKSGLDHARVLLEKAGNDLKLAEIGLVHDAPTDTVAFHLQQTRKKSSKRYSLPERSFIPKHTISTSYSIYCQRISWKCSLSVKAHGLDFLCRGYALRHNRIPRQGRDAPGSKNGPGTSLGRAGPDPYANRATRIGNRIINGCTPGRQVCSLINLFPSFAWDIEEDLRT